MKYSHFLTYLRLKTNENVTIAPAITVKNGKASIRQEWFENNTKFLVFPIKIYYGRIRHLNIALLNNETKVVECFEPFEKDYFFSDVAVEEILLKLMSLKKIYFLSFKKVLGSNTSQKNCGYFCVEYIHKKI